MFDPGALMARHYALADGPRVCLRLARVRDRDGIQRLHEANGIAIDELELARLVRFDPRRRLVICATALLNGSETIVGIGAMELDGELAPWLLLVDARAEGLHELVQGALVGHAQALAAAA